MSSTLSPSAVYRIICFVLPTGKKTKYSRSNRLAFQTVRPQYPHILHRVNKTWKAVHYFYFHSDPAQPVDYLDSLELSLVLKGQVNDADVQAIFEHGKPLEFYGCPPQLVSKIVEAFGALQEEPTYLDVTINDTTGYGPASPSEAWAQVYKTHLPCYACTTVKAVELRRNPRMTYASNLIPPLVGPDKTADFAVEKFHVSSKSFRKRLTLELRYPLLDETTGQEREQSYRVHKISIRLDNESCPAQRRLSAATNRSSATLLLLPEFASEVLGFLDRAHIGSSLLANRGLHDLTCQLRKRLPVHHLRCAFQRDVLSYGRESTYGTYWLHIRHLRRDLSYTDVRRFEVPSTDGAENDCALIRRYLSNSHVADHQAKLVDFSFAIKMLASLADRNLSVGTVELWAEGERLSDYRSMDAVFGEMRMSELHLRCDERRFVELVKTADFFRMSSIQRLQEMQLILTEDEKPRGHAGSKSPLWICGVPQLRDSRCYRVNYNSNRHLRIIERKMVQICEAFERGEITDTVEHFQLNTLSAKRMSYAFSRDNLLVSGMKIEGNSVWKRIGDYEWDVYRFRNASTSEYLTACVAQYRGYTTKCILHLVKGEVYPDASFVDF